MSKCTIENTYSVTITDLTNVFTDVHRYLAKTYPKNETFISLRDHNDFYAAHMAKSVCHNFFNKFGVYEVSPMVLSFSIRKLWVSLEEPKNDVDIKTLLVNYVAALEELFCPSTHLDELDEQLNKALL